MSSQSRTTRWSRNLVEGVDEPFEVPGFECTGIKRDQHNPKEFVMNVRFIYQSAQHQTLFDKLSKKFPNTIFYPRDKEGPQIPFTQIRLLDGEEKSLISDLLKRKIAWNVLEMGNFRTCRALVSVKEVHDCDGKTYFQLVLFATVVCGVGEPIAEFEKDLFDQLVCFTTCKGPCKERVIAVKTAVTGYCLKCSNNEIQRRLNQIVRAVCQKSMVSD